MSFSLILVLRGKQAKLLQKIKELQEKNDVETHKLKRYMEKLTKCHSEVARLNRELQSNSEAIAKQYNDGEAMKARKLAELEEKEQALEEELREVRQEKKKVEMALKKNNADKEGLNAKTIQAVGM